MITIEEHEGLNAGLNKGFFKKITLKNVAKAAFAPHLLIPKNKRGMLIKGALAPHTLLMRKKR